MHPGVLTKVAAVALGVLAAIALYSRPAQALPTFAKAYGVQCSACHTFPPQLNAYGRYIQRTGYAALSRDLVKSVAPVTLSEEPTLDTGTGSGRVEFGNTALHAAGFLSPDITYHVHQWLSQNGQPGGLDTMQVAYNDLFHGNAHLFVGKLSALPVPAPFSDQSDIAGYASAELQVGEHMYQADMMRWGASMSYVHANLFAQVGWLGSNADLNGATDFSSNNDKTVEWIAAYADPANPLEAGVYGSIGAFPLAEGGVDHYHSFAAYIERDPGPHYVPGVFASYQFGYDTNPGLNAMNGGIAAASPSAQSRAWTLEAYEPVWNGRALVGLRREFTDDGLGTIGQSGNINFDVMPFAKYDYLHLYFESALQQQRGPAWRSMLWWAVPLGGR